jgi:Fe-S cluster assembly ATP-binding protein
MLKIKNASAVVNTAEVLKEISLEINPGEIHAIMGPKASGKSMLAQFIQGGDHIKQTEGSITFNRKNIVKLSPDKRSKLGIFTCFQYPSEVVGLTNQDAMKMLLEDVRQIKFDSDLETCYRNLVKELELGSSYHKEFLNMEDRPPADWRKGEIIQMLMINPSLVILDEVDQEQDDHSLDLLAAAILSFMKDKEKSCILITNNKTFLDLIQPTHVHVMVDGKIKLQGNTELYQRIIEDGHTQFS